MESNQKSYNEEQLHQLRQAKKMFIFHQCKTKSMDSSCVASKIQSLKRQSEWLNEFLLRKHVTPKPVHPKAQVDPKDVASEPKVTVSEEHLGIVRVFP